MTPTDPSALPTYRPSNSQLLPHFTLLKHYDLPEHLSYDAIRKRALDKAESHPMKHTNSLHPEGPGLIIEKNYLDYYWKSINKDLGEVLDIVGTKD